MRLFVLSVLLTLALCVEAVSQQPSSPTSPPETPKAKKNKNEPVPHPPEPAAQPQTAPQPPAPALKPESGKEASPDKDKEEHYDMTEVPAVVTHHQITLDGKLLHYTATTGRLPIKRGDGKIEAEMFFVAYTLDGQDAGSRPLTFRVQRRPGIGVGMAAHGSRRSQEGVLQPNGFMPAGALPYRRQSQLRCSTDRPGVRGRDRHRLQPRRQCGDQEVSGA